jgi:flagellar hook-length control protein FliK
MEASALAIVLAVPRPAAAGSRSDAPGADSAFDDALRDAAPPALRGRDAAAARPKDVPATADRAADDRGRRETAPVRDRAATPKTRPTGRAREADAAERPEDDDRQDGEAAVAPAETGRPSNGAPSDVALALAFAATAGLPTAPAVAPDGGPHDASTVGALDDAARDGIVAASADDGSFEDAPSPRAFFATRAAYAAAPTNNRASSTIAPAGAHEPTPSPNAEAAAVAQATTTTTAAAPLNAARSESAPRPATPARAAAARAADGAPSATTSSSADASGPVGSSVNAATVAPRARMHDAVATVAADAADTRTHSAPATATAIAPAAVRTPTAAPSGRAADVSPRAEGATAEGAASAAPTVKAATSPATSASQAPIVGAPADDAAASAPAAPADEIVADDAAIGDPVSPTAAAIERAGTDDRGRGAESDAAPHDGFDRASSAADPASASTDGEPTLAVDAEGFAALVAEEPAAALPRRRAVEAASRGPDGASPAPVSAARGSDRAAAVGEAAAPAPRTAEPDVARALAELRGEMRSGRREIVIRLDPPELGRMDVRLVQRGDAVVARVTLENPEAAESFRRERGALERFFVEQGVPLAGLDVRSGGGFFGRGRREAPPSEEAAAFPSARPVAAPAAPRVRAAAPAATSALDLYV